MIEEKRYKGEIIAERMGVKMGLFKEVDIEIKGIKKQNKKALNDFLIKTEKYRPSNGCEGSWFEDNICGTCKKYDSCKIILNLSFDYVKEIRRFNGIVFCIKHTNFDLSKLLNEVNKWKQ